MEDAKFSRLMKREKKETKKFEKEGTGSVANEGVTSLTAATPKRERDRSLSTRNRAIARGKKRDLRRYQWGRGKGLINRGKRRRIDASPRFEVQEKKEITGRE